MIADLKHFILTFSTDPETSVAHENAFVRALTIYGESARASVHKGNLLSALQTLQEEFRTAWPLGGIAAASEDAFQRMHWAMTSTIRKLQAR